jgi:CDP-glucose 4,6-dehydratase
MEKLVMNLNFWRGRRVLVTGHTGFKGGWLCLWLSSLGAEVHGYALAPSTNPALFDLAKIGSLLTTSQIADIRDNKTLSDTVNRTRPEIIFHLAAQPLVRYSYSAPIETYAVNIMGTAYLLEAVRQSNCVQAVVSITTDKCYDNREWLWSYRENEPLGGHDPYSSSKACVELVCAAYQKSFFNASGVALATARAGNVIGGGDWSKDRLLPDFFRSIDNHEILTIRSPNAIRPWQHVLEPLSGYLALAENLVTFGSQVAEAWNFGPIDEDARSVNWILERLSTLMPELRWQCEALEKPHEANYLKLDSSKARARLDWTPRWRLDMALKMTVEWHRAWQLGSDMRAISLAQIDTFLSSTVQ